MFVYHLINGCRLDEELVYSTDEFPSASVNSSSLNPTFIAYMIDSRQEVVKFSYIPLLVDTYIDQLIVNTKIGIPVDFRQTALLAPHWL